VEIHVWRTRIKTAPDGARESPVLGARSRAEIPRLTFRRFCTPFADSSPASAIIGGLYARATTIARPRSNPPPADGARANPGTSIQVRPLTHPLCAPPRNGLLLTPPGHRTAAALTDPRPAVHPPPMDRFVPRTNRRPTTLNPASRDAIAELRRRSTSKGNAIAASDGNHSVRVQISIHGPARPPRRRNLGLRANSSKY
jgi:hypothetical protein